jgi:hypothetical protein
MTLRRSTVRWSTPLSRSSTNGATHVGGDPIASDDHKEAMYAIVCGRSGPW